MFQHTFQCMLSVAVHRLLLSIDRRRSVADAVETISLAEEYSAPLSAQVTRVVGIDLSGDPTVKFFSSLCCMSR